MSKKNLPNIPLYIGDWERDCNVLSLETEMAWMKIIFKMHLAGKQHVYKTSTKGLEILWKSGTGKVTEIIEELRFNNICEITTIAGGYEFMSRRLRKESGLSLVRSESVKKRYAKPPKGEKQANRPATKAVQITDTENEIDIENEVEVENEVENGKAGMGGKPAVVLVTASVTYPFETENFEQQWQAWKQYRTTEHSQRYRSAESEQAALAQLGTLSGLNEQTAIAILHQSMGKGWKGFFEIKNDAKQSAGKSKVHYSDEFKRKIADRLRSG